MNYTDKYHLPQWEKSDRIMMEDFNRMCQDIESGLKDAVQQGADAATGAGSSAAQAAAKAQATADAALSAANAAQTTADQAYHPGYLPYEVGTYTGNGGTTTVYLGFMPSFVLITGQGITHLSDTSVSDIAVIGPVNNMTPMVTLTDTGMTILDQYESYNPRLNRAGIRYGYIAFR